MALTTKRAIAGALGLVAIGVVGLGVKHYRATQSVQATNNGSAARTEAIDAQPQTTGERRHYRLAYDALVEQGPEKIVDLHLHGELDRTLLRTEPTLLIRIEAKVEVEATSGKGSPQDLASTLRQGIAQPFYALYRPDGQLV